MTYEEFQADVRRRKKERWVALLNEERTGRGPGRRPRDPEQEALLLRLDRTRLARRDLKLTRVSPRPPSSR